MGKLLALAVAAILAAVTWERISSFRQRFKVSRVLEQVEPPNCRLIKGIEAGSEDIDILPNGLAFISSGLKYPGVMSFAPDKPAELFIVDLNEDELKPVALRISRGFDIDSFNPHGISLYIDEKDDAVYLFVVNHPSSATTVELFKFQKEENALLHLKTIRHELLQSVNDVVAVGPESFYATNDHYFVNTIGRMAEMYLGLPWSNAVYYSPEEVKVVASGFDFANGIAVSLDKRYLYVAACLGQSIHVFEIHDNWSVSPVKVLHLHKLVDNLCIDPETGDIWSGGHIDALKVFNYDTESPPGSEVIRVQNIHSENPIVTQVYVNNGSVLQASSVACVHGGRVIVGTVFQKALYCDLN